MPPLQDRCRQKRFTTLNLFLSTVLASYVNASSLGSECPSQVGGPVLAGYQHISYQNIDLLLNVTIPCAGNVSAWLCHKTDPLFPAFVGIWRRLQSGSNIFTLIGKNNIPEGYLGSHVFRIKSKYQIQALPGDYIGYHYRRESGHKTNALRNGLVVKDGNKRQLRSSHLEIGVNTSLIFQRKGGRGGTIYEEDAVLALMNYGDGQGTTITNTMSACKDETLNLYCPKEQVVLVRSAKYGVVPGRCGATLSPERFHQDTCFRPVWHVVHGLCTGKTECHFRISKELFGDPCQGKSLALEVEFSCVYKKLSTTHGKETLLNAGYSGQPSGAIDGSHMMPSVYTFPKEKVGSGAIMAGVIVTVAVIVGFLVAAIFIRRKINSKREDSPLSAHSGLINHHLRLDPAYLSARDFQGARQAYRHQDNPRNALEAFGWKKLNPGEMLEAMKTSLDPGGSLDSAKARFNLQSYLEDTDTSHHCGAMSETLKSTMDFCSCSSSRTLSGVVPDLEPVRDDVDEDTKSTGLGNEYNGNASDDCDSCVDVNVSTAKLCEDKDQKESTKKKSPSVSSSVGPPKPPRIRPYALVSASFLDSDSDDGSIVSEDFTLKPKKFTIWSTTDDEDYASDSERKRHGF